MLAISLHDFRLEFEIQTWLCSGGTSRVPCDVTLAGHRACRTPSAAGRVGQIPDYNEPVVVPEEVGSTGPPTVEYFCNRIHKGLMKQFKYALVWGASAKHCPQRCGKDHPLMDEDVIQIVKKVG